MKTKDHFQLHADAVPIDRAASYHSGSSPNSSALFAVTVPAEAEDILAAIRTAVLLGRTFKSEVSVDVFGANAIRIEPGESISKTELLALLASIQGKLRDFMASESGAFVLEGTWTNASFITAGTISLSVHGTASEPKGLAVAR